LSEFQAGFYEKKKTKPSSFFSKKIKKNWEKYFLQWAIFAVFFFRIFIFFQLS